MPSPSDELTWSPATPADLAAVASLLSANGLPHEDIGEHIARFILIKDGDKLIATAALEPCGGDGLLRSVCVSPDYRRHGLAAGLCRKIEARAREMGLLRLYLLTTTATAFFEKRGFSVCGRGTVPTAVRDTAEFRSLCPATAVCMVRHLG